MGKMSSIYFYLSGIILYFTLIKGEIKRPRGVAISKAAFYDPSRDFTCLDGSSAIPFERVNDDYCDCTDGSDEPGTAACPNGSFHCTNAGHKPKYVPSSRVNDAICDCCDGTDEYNGKVTCANYCSELGRQMREEQDKERLLAIEGHEVYKEYCQKGQEAIREKRERLEQAKNEKDELQEKRDELETIKIDAEVPEKEAKDKHKAAWEEQKVILKIADDKQKCEDAFKELDSNDNGLVSISEVQGHPEFDIDSNGAVSLEEAKEYLEDLEEVDYDTFVDKVWSHIKDIYKKPSPSETTEEGEEKPAEYPWNQRRVRRSQNRGNGDKKHPPKPHKPTLLDDPEGLEKLGIKVGKYPFKVSPDKRKHPKKPIPAMKPKRRPLPVHLTTIKGLPRSDTGRDFLLRDLEDVTDEGYVEDDAGDDEGSRHESRFRGENGKAHDPKVGKWKYRYDDKTGKYQSSVYREKPGHVDAEEADEERDEDEDEDEEGDHRPDPEDYDIDDYDEEFDHEDDDKKKDDEEMPEYDEETKNLIKTADEARAAFNDIQQQINSLDSEIKDLEKLVSLDLGPNHEFYPLRGECYEFSDREYTYKMCPFDRCSQRSKHGGVETNLGNWEDWEGEGDSKYFTMKFTKGQNCWNGPDRSVKVKVSCGLQNQVMSSSEPNRCEYEYTFSTPAVCSKLPEPERKDYQHDEF